MSKPGGIVIDLYQRLSLWVSTCLYVEIIDYIFTYQGFTTNITS